MDSRLRGNDGERFARMARTHDCVVSDLSLSFPGNPLGIIVIHTGVLFLNQPSLPCLGPFFQAHLHHLIRQNRLLTSRTLQSNLPILKYRHYWQVVSGGALYLFLDQQVNFL